MIDLIMMFIKFNLHLIESCNYKCKYCFSIFEKPLKCLSWEDAKLVVDHCIKAFPNCSFNLAGGEPFMLPYLSDLIHYIYEHGCKVSIITNGSFITIPWIQEHAPFLDTIGFSIDSFDESTLKKIGRCSKSGEMLSKDKLVDIIQEIRRVNPKCKIKINTVISSLNKDEIMSNEILSLSVDRWKIFKMKTFTTKNFNNSALTISDEDYNNFVLENLECERSLLKEKDSFTFKLSSTCQVVVEKTLAGGYLIIDPNGDLIDNTNDSYKTIGNCMQEDVQSLINRLPLDKELYQSRYKD